LSRLFRPSYWRKECDNALHMIPAWKDALTQDLLTARAVNGLQARVRQAITFPMLGRAKPMGLQRIPSNISSSDCSAGAQSFQGGHLEASL
jgi:hypothetical protein